MTQDKKWIPLGKALDYLENNDPIAMHIDTRDFHCIFNGFISKKIKRDMDILIKYKERFFFTKEEIKNLLVKFYEESGSESKWRFITTSEIKEWIKYIRFLKTPYGFIMILNQNQKAINKNKIGTIDRDMLNNF